MILSYDILGKTLESFDPLARSLRRVPTTCSPDAESHQVADMSTASQVHGLVSPPESRRPTVSESEPRSRRKSARCNNAYASRCALPSVFAYVGVMIRADWRVCVTQMHSMPSPKDSMLGG